MVKTKRIVAISLLCAGLISGGFVIPADAAAKKAPVKKTVVKKVKAKAVPSPKVARRLDGVSVIKRHANNRIIAVMIENHPAARPQAGLQDASIVYETLAEGGIPRFMALYSHYGDVKQMGPVRSLRPYFVSIAAEYGAAMAHAGGSPDGLTKLKKIGLRNIEGLKGPTAKYFFRLGWGVHSLFTDGKKIERLNNSWPKIAPTYKSWKYVGDPPRAQRRKGKHGAAIRLGPGAQYTIDYKYDLASNMYLRSTGGRAHIDRNTRKQVKVRNVLLQFVPKERVLDRKGRLDLKVGGAGKGVLMKDGKAFTVTWTKKGDRGRTIFKYTNGKEIELNRGNTWVTIIPKGRSYRVF